jgi:hypothetical protein
LVIHGIRYVRDITTKRLGKLPRKVENRCVNFGVDATRSHVAAERSTRRKA